MNSNKNYSINSSSSYSMNINTPGRTVLHQRSDGQRGRRARSGVLWQALQLLHWPVTFCWPQMPVTQAADFIEDELVRARKSRGAPACAHTVARRTRDSVWQKARRRKTKTQGFRWGSGGGCMQTCEPTCTCCLNPYAVQL